MSQPAEIKDIQTLLKALDKHNYAEFHDYNIVLLILDTVIRTSELMAIKNEDHDPEAMSNLILTVMLAFAEYERGMIVKRTQTGKAVAKQDPSFKDRRPKMFKPEQINLALSLLAQGKTYRQITIMTGISKSTLIRAKNNSPAN